MSGINVEYSQGFNPRARISVASALPLGATGDNELLTLRLAGPVEPGEIASALNRVLPEGLSITCVEICPDNYRGPAIRASEFAIEVAGDDPDLPGRLAMAVGELMSRASIEIVRESGGRRRTIDIRPGIESLEVSAGPANRTARITMTLPHREFTVKPSEIFGQLKTAVPGLTTRSAHRNRLILTTQDP
jgi:radical SAM-linked protein